MASQLFGLDVRSLALFRIALGLLLLTDLGIRASSLQAHYTDAGVMPRQALPDGNMLSVHALGGSAAFEGILFAVAGLFATAMLLGYRTRLATAFSWFLLMSLQARNPLIQNGGDVLFRLLLFWGMFLPLGACWSIDSMRTSAPRLGRTSVLSAATLALTLQICFTYWFSAAAKSHPVWRHEGTALYYALGLGSHATSFGAYVRGFPPLLKWLTFGTLVLEALGPLFLFLPVRTGPARLVVVAIFLLFHAAIRLCLTIGIFPLVCGVAWLVLLPSWFWDRVSRRSLPVATPCRHKHRRPNDCPLSPQKRSIFAWLPVRWASWAINLLICGLLAYVLCYNLGTLRPSKRSRVISPQMARVGQMIGLNQYWNMFAPCPLLQSGWYVVQGRLRDGQEVDVRFGGRPVSWEKPKLISATYPDHHWRLYGLTLRMCDKLYLSYYADYLRREWDSRHAPAQQLHSLDIYFMLEETPPPGAPSSPRQKLRLFGLTDS